MVEIILEIEDEKMSRDRREDQIILFQMVVIIPSNTVVAKWKDVHQQPSSVLCLATSGCRPGYDEINLDLIY